jgi:hypothetical protein
MLQLYDLTALDRSGDLLREADEYRRWAAGRTTSTPLTAVRVSAGRALTGLGKRIAGAA